MIVKPTERAIGARKVQLDREKQQSKITTIAASRKRKITQHNRHG